MKSPESYAGNSTHTYRPEIDGLRAIAVLAVVFYHFDIPGFSGGYVGVDVFFVISGFLITRIIIDELNAGTFSLTNFYFRRARRILPAFFAMIAATTIAALFLLTPSEMIKYSQSLFASSTFWANYYFLGETGYFAGPSSELPLLHTWSLSIEEQFYIIMPIFFILFFKYTILKKNIKSVIIFFIVLSIFHAELELVKNPQKAFFALPTRIWELAFGSLIALGLFPALRNSYLNFALAMFGLGLIAFSIYFYDNNTRFPGFSALVPCLGAALFIVFTNKNKSILIFIVENKVLVTLGMISYSLYLWHWPVLSFAKISTFGEMSTLQTLSALSFSFAVAAISWRFVETPFRRIDLALPNKRRFLRTAAYVIILFMSLGLMIERSNGLPQRVSSSVRAADILPNRQKNLHEECHEGEEVRQLRICSFGVRNKQNYDVVLWGDSHSLPYISAFSQRATTNNWYGASLSSPGCPPLINSFRYDNGHKRIDCAKFIKRSFEMLNKIKPKLVVLISRWSLYSNNDHKNKQVFLTGLNDKSLSNETSKSALVSGLVETTKALIDMGAKVLIVAQTPEFKYPVTQCIARRLHFSYLIDDCVKIDKISVEQRMRFVNEIIFKIIEKDVNVRAFFPINHLCDNRYCYAVKDNNVLYSDEHHINFHGALYLSKFIELDIAPSNAFSKLP